MGPAYFFLANFAAAVFAARAGKLLARRRDPWLAAAAVVFAFILAAIAITGALGLAGLLSGGAAAATAWVLAAAVFVFKPGGILAGPQETPERVSLLELAALAAACALAATVAAQAVLLPLNYLPDDLSYHGPAAASWLAARRLVLAPLNYQAYYSMNAELFSLWFMLPFHSDALVGMAGLCWSFLLGLSAAALARRLGAGHGAAALAGGLAMASIPAMAQAGSFAGADLAGAAAALAALAFAAESGSQPRFSTAVASGLAAGLAMGCKPSFFPAAAAALVWLTWAANKNSRRNAIRMSAAFTAAAFITGGGFYLRNLVLTGNPVFPAPLGPLPGGLDGALLSRTRLAAFLPELAADPAGVIPILRGFGYWPFLVGLSAAAGYAAAAGRFRAGRAGATAWVFAAGLAMALVFPFLPFSGSDLLPVPVLRSAPRFVIFEAAIGLILLASLAALKGWRGAAATGLLLFAAIDAVRGQIFHPPAVYSAAAAVPAFFAVRAICRRMKKSPPLAFAAPALALFAALALLAALGPTKAKQNRQALYALYGPASPVGRAWQEIDHLPPGSRLAWFGPAAYRYYPLFGRGFRLVPVKVNADGRTARPLHVTIREASLAKSGPAEVISPRRLIENLRDAGIDYVFITKGDGDEWPGQQTGLKNSPGAEPVYNDGGSAIWKLK